LTQPVIIRCGGDDFLSADHLHARSSALVGPQGRPCVVMAHGVGATRDCGLMPFAEGLASCGTDVLIFDYRHFAGSSGAPSHVVSPKAQIEDYQSAVRFARTIRGVDPERIVLWGVSLSAGHVLKVAAADKRIAAVISLTPAVDGLAALAQMLRPERAGILLRLLGLTAADALAAILGRSPVMAPIVARPGEAAALNSPGALEGMLAIAGPTWRNFIAARVFLQAPFYRPRTAASDISCPTLVQIAARDHTAPVEPVRKMAAAMSATLCEYAGDHFDVYPGAPCFDAVLKDQRSFLARVAVPVSAEVAR